MVGGVEAALQQPAGSGVDDFFQTVPDLSFLRGQVLPGRQVLQVRDDLHHAEGRVRRGKEIAGHVVEQAILVLHPLDVVQSQADALEDRLIVIEFRLPVAVGRNHGGDPVDGVLGLIDAVRLGKRAVPGAALNPVLDLQGTLHVFLRVPQNSVVMCFHIGCYLATVYGSSRAAPMMPASLSSCARIICVFCLAFWE